MDAMSSALERTQQSFFFYNVVIKKKQITIKESENYHNMKF